jgi:hypothetical protein
MPSVFILKQDHEWFVNKMPKIKAILAVLNALGMNFA